MKPHASFYLTADQLAALRGLAKKKGYTVKRGPRSGEGNVSKMLQAIAAGDVTLVKLR